MSNRNLVLKHFREMREKAVRLWGNRGVNLDLVEFNYSLSSTRVLGSCLTIRIGGSPAHTIKLNETILDEKTELYIKEVLTHEICHAIVGELFPSGRNGYKRVMPHGKEFKAVCSHFGISGKSTANESFIERKSSNRKTFTYQCNCSTYELSSIRHNRIVREGQSYSCKKCKSELKRKLKNMIG